MALKEKSYDPNESSLTFVDREDASDFSCEGSTSLRALMSCGHVVTPTSLKNCCRRLLNQGKSRFVCGQSGCNAEWSYEEVCKMALLTPEEMQLFEKTMTSNAARSFPTKLCPKCKCTVMRRSQSNLRVCCTVCPANKGRTFKFCWQCLKKWRGLAPRSDRCANYGCTNQSVNILRHCPDATFESVEGVTGCPSMRACPTCGMLLQHDNTQCKNVVCPQCRKEFCFVCLKLTKKCLITSEEYMPCSRGVAPRQTSIPVWRKKYHKQVASVCSK
ncbi:probable E3 ubiquitin-protein ligase RNF144A [Anabas testudineus]|nr:probable E3 ubiquitin-protein ligase RNF144A [Anabas testudineus]